MQTFDTLLCTIRAQQSDAARERLTTLRHKLGITQTQFAESIGISVSLVRAYERGAATADPARADAAEQWFAPLLAS